MNNFRLNHTFIELVEQEEHIEREEHLVFYLMIKMNLEWLENYLNC